MSGGVRMAETKKTEKECERRQSRRRRLSQMDCDDDVGWKEIVGGGESYQSKAPPEPLAKNRSPSTGRGQHKRKASHFQYHN